MLNVFVSRPTWVGPEFRQGLDGFLRLLRSLELQPRTLGTTDYPNRAPLDEVIDLLGQCAGAVILGYPQICASSGFVRDQAIEQTLVLPTEWNHIEAGLAYARGLPLLVIHHHSVSRGIFDRGASPTYLYERDLTLPEWPLADDLQGAVTHWKDECLRPQNAAPPARSPESDVQGGRAQGADARRGIERAATNAVVSALRRDDPTMYILRALARLAEGYHAVRDVAAEADEPVIKARYCLQGLQQLGYVNHATVQGENELRYCINDRGVSVLLAHGAL